jgi:hypothetical protein
MAAAAPVSGGSPDDEDSLAPLARLFGALGSPAMRLAAAGNVEVPAILLLEDRGYVITVTRADDAETWTARRGDLELVGNGPLELLGLANLAEALGPSWRATDEQIERTLARFGIA